MPIFMDLHIIPGVKAKEVAEAHQHDLLIQNEFNCTCMTYWIDEPKNSVFCLIDAPNAQAVKDLHNKSHGLAPHKIIQVNKTIVESFLGRIYDPYVEGVPERQLKIFNDPAFRILLLINMLEAGLIKKRYGQQGVDLLKRYREISELRSEEYEGEITANEENVSQILSFTSAQKAVACAVAVQSSFTAEERHILDLKISLNAGVPVEESRRLFGDTIDFGKTLFYTAGPDKIVIASVVKKILDRNFMEKIGFKVSALNTSEEKKLAHLISVLGKNIGNEDFGVDELAKELSLSKSGLNRMINSLTGRTPNSLIKEFRLNTALDLIKENSYSVSQIAFTTGFTSPSYFSKCFREFYGLSPSFFMDQKGL